MHLNEMYFWNTCFFKKNCIPTSQKLLIYIFYDTQVIFKICFIPTFPSAKTSKTVCNKSKIKP